MIKKVNFKHTTLNTFNEILGVLHEACCPPVEQIQPIIQINSPRDNFGSTFGNYPVEDLDHMVQTKQVLPSHISVIKMDGVNWFSPKDNPLDFYSTKHYVTLDFAPQRLVNPKILKNKSVLNSVKKMLALIGRGKSAEDASTAFSDDVCRKVYEISSPREYILAKMMTSIEQVRRIIFTHLDAHHRKDIQLLPEFRAFQKANPEKSGIFDFLRSGYKGFSLAEKWGYIKNSKALIDIQKMRHTPRHAAKYMPNPFDSEGGLENMTEEDWNQLIYHNGYPYQNPTKLFDHFQKALYFAKPKAPKDVIAYDDATISLWAQKDIEQFKKIFYSLPHDKNLELVLRKSFPEEISTETVVIEKEDMTQVSEPVAVFSSFYIRGNSIAPIRFAEEQPDGTMLFKEGDFHNWIKASNDSAHANPGFQKCAKILSDDWLDLSEFVEELSSAKQKRSSLLASKTSSQIKKQSGR